MEIIQVDKILYKPQFDPDTGSYRDVSPFKHRSRNNPLYECRCQAGSFFNTNSQFKQHCHKKTHRIFLGDYEYYYKDADVAKQEIKEYRIENEKLQRKLDKCIGLLNIREQEIAFLNGIQDMDAQDSEDEFVDATDGK